MAAWWITTYEHAKKYDLPTDVKNFYGVLLEQLDREGQAAQRRMKLGDIIVKVDNVVVNSQAAFEEELSFHNPGDKISFTYQRDGKQHTANITPREFQRHNRVDQAQDLRRRNDRVHN